MSVFQSKVLRRLYPATPKLEKKPSPPHSVEGLANKACVKRKTPKGGLVIGKVTVKNRYINIQTHDSLRATSITWLLLLLFIFVTGNKETTQSVANPGRRVYTVVPPPADFKAHAEESVNLPSSGSTNSDKDSAGEKTVIACGFFFYLCHACFCLI